MSVCVCIAAHWTTPRSTNPPARPSACPARSLHATIPPEPTRQRQLCQGGITSLMPRFARLHQGHACIARPPYTMPAPRARSLCI
jgi:hypothetical protein